MSAPIKPAMPIVAECPICERTYVWVPKDGGTCRRCGCKLTPVKEVTRYITSSRATERTDGNQQTP